MNIYEFVGAIVLAIATMAIPTYCFRSFAEDWNLVAKVLLCFGVLLETVLLCIFFLDSAINKHKKR